MGRSTNQKTKASTGNVKSKVKAEEVVAENAIPTEEVKDEEVQTEEVSTDLDEELKALLINNDAKVKQSDIAPMIIPVVEEPVFQWKKVGGGSFQLNNRYIKPNERFYAKESDIPLNFRDVVVKLSGTVVPPAPAASKHAPVVYALVPSSEEGLFDIVDSFGKKINEASLEKSIALSFIQSLQS